MFKGLGRSVVVASLVLTGCDTFSLLRDQQIADTFRVGADKRSVSRDFGMPNATLPTLNGQGVCHDYNHRLPNGAVTPFYVGFRNSDGKVVAFGPTTCREAQANGNLNSDEPIKQRF
ncbi:hypothetical protein BHU62_01345 [Serratia marcescens]|uniref:Osmotically-inducible lipoprotein OsmE n=1 Tax=Serratia marcescens TaxID=615 RepID=A0A1Q4P6I2_SERMA|nr:hypothetical protein [Serratia marcescens]OKB68718.1 hypothetical protein BHU62_01345 [Serratia marcescens]